MIKFLKIDLFLYNIFCTIYWWFYFGMAYNFRCYLYIIWKIWI